MSQKTDTFYWRRFSRHWFGYAEKARLSAFALWSMRTSPNLSQLAIECGSRSEDSGHALYMAFRRECALALELVLKSVLAEKINVEGADPMAKVEIPTTHDIPKLWLHAGLPSLSKEDKKRLLLAKSILVWSGRYPTPKTPKAWVSEMAEFHSMDTGAGAKFVFTKPLSIDWNNFDRLYQVAKSEVVKLSDEAK